MTEDELAAVERADHLASQAQRSHQTLEQQLGALVMVMNNLEGERDALAARVASLEKALEGVVASEPEKIVAALSAFLNERPADIAVALRNLIIEALR